MFNEKEIKSFSTTDMRIYNYILKHSIQFPYMSIRELADEIPTSTASIMRFVKKMGYDSFPELKYAYKKEEKEVSSESLFAIASGDAIEMSEIKDPMFAEGIMGPCAAIEPADGKIYAPADGTISFISESEHAIGIITNVGAEILLHLGIDTVKITDEKVFDTKITMGQKVKKGDLLTVMDLDGVERHQCQKTVITIVTNYNSYTDIAQVKTGSITPDDIIMELSL